MKIAATIEARMSSSRLAGKVLFKANDKPMLLHLVNRLRAVPSIDEIVLATTTNPLDSVLVDFACSCNIKYYRGSEDDVMTRVIEAAESVQADVVVEITGDCPIIDPLVIEQTIQTFLLNPSDYVSNCHVRSYPVGMDTQVFPLATLKKSASMTKDALDHEHVTLHIRNNPNIFKTLHLPPTPDLFWPELGLTLDENDDYLLLKKIIEHFGPTNELFSCREVIDLLKKNPKWVDINRNVARKGDS